MENFGINDDPSLVQAGPRLTIGSGSDVAINAGGVVQANTSPASIRRGQGLVI